MCVYIYLNVVCITAAPEGSSWESEAAALPANIAKRGSYIASSSQKFRPNQRFYSKIHLLPGEWPGGKFPNPKLLNERQKLERAKACYATECVVLPSSSPNIWISDSVVWGDNLDWSGSEHTVKLPFFLGFLLSFSHSEKWSCFERERRDRFDRQVWWKQGGDSRVGEMLAMLLNAACLLDLPLFLDLESM